MINIKFRTHDLIIYEQCGEIIVVNGEVGGYRQVGDEEYFFYSDKLDISDEDKLKFETRVRELIRVTKSFMESV